MLSGSDISDNNSDDDPTIDLNIQFKNVSDTDGASNCDAQSDEADK